MNGRIHSFIQKCMQRLFQVATQKRSQLQCGQEGRFSNDLEMYRYVIYREETQLLREIIPSPRARHRECAVLLYGQAGPPEPPLRRTKGSATQGPDTGRQRSIRQAGARPSWHRQTRETTLY